MRQSRTLVSAENQSDTGVRLDRRIEFSGLTRGIRSIERNGSDLQNADRPRSQTAHEMPTGIEFCPLTWLSRISIVILEIHQAQEGAQSR